MKYKDGAGCKNNNNNNNNDDHDVDSNDHNTTHILQRPNKIL